MADSVFDRIHCLNLNLGDYVVVSGGVLGGHGIRKAGDVDMVVTNQIFEKFRSKGWLMRKGNGGLNLLNNEGYELAQNWNYNRYLPNPEKLIGTAEIINGCAFARFNEVVRFKREINRMKDRRDIALIEQYLKNRFTGYRSLI